MRRPRRLIAILAADRRARRRSALAYAATTTISISGATASFPLIELLTAKYRKLKHGKVSFKVSQGGATVGIQDAAAGRVEHRRLLAPAAPRPTPTGSSSTRSPSTSSAS